MPHPPGFLVDLVRLCAWLAILSVIFIPLERLLPLHRAPVARPGLWADLGYYFLGGMTTALILSLPFGLLAWYAHDVIPRPVTAALAAMPLGLKLAVGFVVGECGHYWGHRLLHAVPLLWRFHAIHHSAPAMDFLVNTRAHPIDLVFSRLSMLIPLYVFDLATPLRPGGSMLPVILALFGTIWSFFIHANVRCRLGPLEWLLTSPGFHHWHHAKELPDHNFASTLPLLDWAFGTFHLPPRQWPRDYGVTGVIPATFAGQLGWPLGLAGVGVRAVGSEADRTSSEGEVIQGGPVT